MNPTAPQRTYHVAGSWWLVAGSLSVPNLAHGTLARIGFGESKHSKPYLLTDPSRRGLTESEYENHLEFAANVIVYSNGTGSWFVCTIVLRHPITLS